MTRSNIGAALTHRGPGDYAVSGDRAYGVEMAVEAVALDVEWWCRRVKDD